MSDPKPVVVRVKRKPTQEPLAALWLEINERPPKKPLLDFSSLTISDTASGDVARAKKVLVQHVDTFSDSQAAEDVLQSLLINHATPERWQKCIEERRCMLRKVGKKHEHLHSVSVRKHENLARNARFEQIWHKRRSKKDVDNSLVEGCQLYDVARVDEEEEIFDQTQESGIDTAEDEMLRNYLPMLRECIPTAAAEIEADLVSREGGYVYDIYTMDDGDMDGCSKSTFTEYPLVQVNGADDYYDGPSGSEYDSDDSNADRSELHDYPDEESSERSQEDEDEKEGFDDQQESESESEYDGMVKGDEEEMESLRLRFRQGS